MNMTLKALVELCANSGVNVRDDSRATQKGDIFVAIPGNAGDGSVYAKDAVSRGAAFVVGEKLPESIDGEFRFVECADARKALWQLAEARWHTGEHQLEIIGITGTNGKTTSAFLLEHLFSALGKKTGVLGTVSYRWPGTILPAPLTTPGPLQLHSILADMAADGVETTVMEVSSHALAQQRVGGIPFSGALFTNLSQDHLDFHKDMESYFRAKARLFFELPLKDKTMAISQDDEYGRRLLELLPKAISFGLHKRLSPKNHLLGEIISSGTKGLHLKMSFKGKTWELISPLVGEFNAMNLLGVQALALGLGVEIEDLRALGDFHGVCGRMERVKNPQNLHVFVDYAHTPDALENVLKTLRGAGFEKIVTVFGCGGNRDRGKRPLMGKAVAELSDIAVLTSDNPRFEEPEAILRDVLPGLEKAKKVFVEVDRKKATALALDLLGPDDALLIAGKGHEDYQIIGSEKHHYSDQEVVRELLNCA